MKRRALSAILCMSMVLGCATTVFAGEENETKTFDGEEISILWVSNSTMDGINAVIEAAEEKLDIKISLEQAPGGEDGDNVVKTRLASPWQKLLKHLQTLGRKKRAVKIRRNFF